MQSVIELDQTFRKHSQRKQYEQTMVQEYGMCKHKYLTQNVYKYTKHLHILLKTARNADCHPHTIVLPMVELVAVSSSQGKPHFCAISTSVLLANRLGK